MPTGKRSRAGGAAAPAENAAGPSSSGSAGGAADVVALHRSRMFDWKPAAVVVVAPCPSAPLFAVGYENGSLELWDVHQLVCTQMVVGPSLELTSLAWARDTVSNSWRTFAAFLDGTVAEVLWRQATVAHSADSYGGVVWALATSPVSSMKPGFAHVLAAACDDGSVRLFACEGGEPGLVPERVLARLEGRLLCCAWHAGGTQLVVAGSAGNIHLLDAVTGRELQRITAAAATTRPVTVWRVLSLPDGTVVSGDSDGAVQMWDARFGTLLQRFVQHKADVLALAAVEDGSSIFAAGVDSQVAMFARVPGSGGRPDSWAYTHYKRPHTHDVRALAMQHLGSDKGSLLISAGLDAQLIAYPAQAFLQEHPHRLSKCPQRPICHASSGAAAAAAAAAPPRLLIAQHDVLDVWQLADAADAGGGGGAAARHAGHRSGAGGAVAVPPEGEPLELLSAPRHLARVQVKGARVASASLSPSGAFVACTTPLGTRVYQLSAVGAEGGHAGAASGSAVAVTVKRLRLEAPAEAPAAAVVVTDSHVVLALRDGSLLAASLPEGEVTARAPPRSVGPAASGAGAAQWTADAQAWRNHCAPAASLVASPDGSQLAAVGCYGISLHHLPSLEQHGRLLRADGAFTAAAFSCDGRLLAATTSSCQLLVWDTTDGRQLAWCVDNAEAATAVISRLPGAPTAISFCPTAVGGASARVAAAGGAAGGAAGAGAAAAAAPQPVRLVVNSPGGMVHFDISRPVSADYLQALTARRSRGRLRPDQRPPPEHQPESRGSNGRVIRTPHPSVWLGHVGPASLLLLEKPWEEVLAALPPPLLVHRYGG